MHHFDAEAREFPISKNMTLIDEPSAKQWLFGMMESLSHDDFIEMVVKLWVIWYARCHLIPDGDQQCTLSTFLFVKRFLDDLARSPKPPTVRRMQINVSTSPRSLENKC